jgi:hypothetical protein
MKIDGFVKISHPHVEAPRSMKINFIFVVSLKMSFVIIPAKAGIQSFQKLINTLDSGFHRRDDSLGEHQNNKLPIFKRLFPPGA